MAFYYQGTCMLSTPSSLINVLNSLSELEGPWTHIRHTHYSGYPLHVTAYEFPAYAMTLRAVPVRFGLSSVKLASLTRAALFRPDWSIETTDNTTHNSGEGVHVPVSPLRERLGACSHH